MSLEEGALPDEAISWYLGIASGKEQERPRNDITLARLYIVRHLLENDILAVQPL
jgi:hypothetical protein